MRVIERGQSVLVNKSKIQEIYTFPDFPINMLSKNVSDMSDDLLFDMKIGICKETGIIQLMELPSNEYIYKDSHSNAVGEAWHKHHCLVSELIKKESPKKVLELGGATGKLEAIYNHDKPKTDEWVIIEPEPNPVKDSHAVFIKGFFPESFPDNYIFDVLVHTHVMEHLYDPISFMEEIEKRLEVRRKMIFSVPDLKRLLKDKAISVLNFEHSIFLTEDYIEFILKKTGFEVLNKEYYGNGHSIIYCVQKGTGKLNNLQCENFYYKNKKLYLDYASFYKEKVSAINKFIENKSNDIFLFGGHISAQYFQAFGLNFDRINGIIDNDVSKQGKRVCKTRCVIQSPQVLKEYFEPIVILPESPYSKEIKKGIIENININTIFLE